MLITRVRQIPYAARRMAYALQADGEYDDREAAENGTEIQRIGLGIVRAPQKPRGAKQTPSQWFGKQLERFGRRLQRRTPATELATVRIEIN